MEIRAGKRFRSKAERRAIVEETMKAGASVSVVARAHDVNANQVFQWRRQYRQGWLDEGQNAASSALVPVKISSKPSKTVAAEKVSKSSPVRPGAIEIDFGHARMRIEGAADPDCVRAAVEGLVP